MVAKTVVQSLNEAADIVSLRQYITKQTGIKPTSSSRGQFHIRFPLDQKEADFDKFFNKFGLEVKDFPGTPISSKFQTHSIQAKTNLEMGKIVIPKGTAIPWVNNNVGAAVSGAQLFNNKDLSPDRLGLAGKQLDANKIIMSTSKALIKNYEPDVSKELINLLRQAKTKSNVVTLSKELSFSSKDLAKVSADYGEILAAVWSQTALGFKESKFPLASNEPLVDIFGIRLGVEFPISVKSGGGGKVTIQNIIDSIKKRAKTATLSHNEEPSLVVFKIVNENSAKVQMIMLHQFMKTPAIKILGKIMKMNPNKITLKDIEKFVSTKSNKQLIKLLDPFWKSVGQKLTPRVLNGPDKVRLIISPLGESIWKILNNDKKIKESLERTARQVMLIQINVDVTKRNIKFQSNHFKEASFEFGWAGYTAGNKLGFKMKVKK